MHNSQIVITVHLRLQTYTQKKKRQKPDRRDTLKKREEYEEGRRKTNEPTALEYASFSYLLSVKYLKINTRTLYIHSTYLYIIITDETRVQRTSRKVYCSEQ